MATVAPTERGRTFDELFDIVIYLTLPAKCMFFLGQIDVHYLLCLTFIGLAVMFASGRSADKLWCHRATGVAVINCVVSAIIFWKNLRHPAGI